MSRATLTATRPHLALQSYLDDLLQEATAELELPAALAEPSRPVVEAVPVPVPVPVPVAAPVVAAPDLSAEFAAAVQEERARDALRLAPVAEPSPVAMPAPLPHVLPVPAEPVPVEPLVELAPAPGTAVPLAPQATEGPPAWGEAPFECLLFDVAGLTLAVPLASLGSIYPLEEDALTPLFGQPDWFLGLLPCQAGNLRVLDTARWLMPERYRDDFREGLRFVISVQGYEWGLAVHQVSRSIRLHPQEVKWRTQRTQRPWLAGTVIEHMCALVDVAALAELIASGATKVKQEPAAATARR